MKWGSKQTALEEQGLDLWLVGMTTVYGLTS